MREIRPSDAIAGGDETLDDFADGLAALAAAVREDAPLHIGNVEWIERHARFLRDESMRTEADDG